MVDKPKIENKNDSPATEIESCEIRYRSEKFNVSVEKLKEAVEAVGPIVEEIRKFLNSNE